MRLSRYRLKEEIFIDANIISYHFDKQSKHHSACDKFLKKIEADKIKGVISNFIIDEVLYILLMQRGSELLKTDRLWKIHEEFRTNRSFTSECYKLTYKLFEYLEVLRLAGLKIIDIGFNIMKESLLIGEENCLLPRDAIHATTCKVFGIKNIATNDPDFDNIHFLKVWKP